MIKLVKVPDRLRGIASDWERYEAIEDPKERNGMLRDLVIETGGRGRASERRVPPIPAQKVPDTSYPIPYTGVVNPKPTFVKPLHRFTLLPYRVSDTEAGIWRVLRDS